MTPHSSQLNPAGVRFQHHFYKTVMTGKPCLVEPSIVFGRDIHPTTAFPSSIFNCGALQLECSLRKGKKEPRTMTPTLVSRSLRLAGANMFTSIDKVKAFRVRAQSVLNKEVRETGMQAQHSNHSN